MSELSPAARESLAAFLAARAGQHLSDTRLPGIVNSLRLVRAAYGLTTLDSLVDQIGAEPHQRLAMDCLYAMMNNETSFFRDRTVFGRITGPVLSGLRRKLADRRVLRVWSVACSTGQEPLSLAMTFAEQRHLWAGWKIDILATDISESAIARAEAACYSQMEIQRGLPTTLMIRYFRPRKGEWVASDALRAMIRYRRHNILDRPPEIEPFDLILCRNLMIYQTSAAQQSTMGNLVRSTNEGGVLVLGSTETMPDRRSGFRPSRSCPGLYVAEREGARHAARLASVSAARNHPGRGMATVS